MVEKPCERGKVARPGVAIPSRLVPFSSASGPDREGDELSFSKDSLPDEEVVGMGRNVGGNSGGGGLSGERREMNREKIIFFDPYKSVFVMYNMFGFH